MMGSLTILQEDDDLIVIHKPPGIAVQTRRTEEQDCVSLLKNRRASQGEEPYVAPVNRLDQPVEGIVLFAKNAKAAAELSGQLARGSMEKYYLAVVTNRELPERAELVDYIQRDAKTNLSRIVPEGTKDGKKARLVYQVVERQGKYALIRICLYTGRHHQIRAQLAHYGWQVLGDQKYGSVRENLPDHALALCAYRLIFDHPRTGKKLTFEVPPQGKGFDGFRV